MGIHFSSCRCCKDHSRVKNSEDFEVKKNDGSDKYPEYISSSFKSISLENRIKSDIMISEEISSINEFSNSLESTNKEVSNSTAERKKNIFQTSSLNTINEITDSEVIEFLSSDVMQDEIFNLNLSLSLSSELALKSKTSSNGTCYRGESDSVGRPHGRGIRVDKDGNQYIGYFYEGLPHGVGKLVTATRDVYQGEFFKGKLHGNAVCISSDGTRYEGSFKKGQLNGMGKEIRANGTEYEGEYYKNLRQGKGKLKTPDGSVYTGDFYCDKSHGTGKKVWADKTYYEGDWDQDQMHGQGLYNFQDGKIFKGQYKKNQISGPGKLKILNSKVFKGEWKQLENNTLVLLDTKTKKETIFDIKSFNSYS
jgi:hypothetical protein